MASDPIRDLVVRLSSADVHLYVDGAELKYRARKGALREADRERVRENKDAIIDYLCRLRQVETERRVVLPPIERAARGGEGLPLSYGQQRLWFIDQFEGGSGHYNTQSSAFIEGELDVTALRAALDALLDRHEILRTCYVDVGGEPRQVVREHRSLPLTCRDLGPVPDVHKQAQIDRWMQDDAAAPFDLRADLLVRASIITLTADAHLLVVTMHHIAGDGWSAGIFERELRELYDAHRSGRPARLRPLEIQYGDYAVWQRGRFREEFIEKQLAYWKERLAGAPLLHSLPLDRARPSRQAFTGRMQRRFIDADTTRAIRAICDARGVTLFMLMQTAFAVLLGRHSRQKDIVMGVSVAGRIHQDLEGMIGLFLNLLVLRTDLSGRPTFWELLERNKKMILEAHEHQYVPFERIVEELCPERNLSHNALVQILFGVQNNEQPAAQLPAGDGDGGGMAVPERSFVPASAHFDLKLDVHEVADGLVLLWLHDDALFADASMQRLAQAYEALLCSVVEDFAAGARGRGIDDLELVGAAARSELVPQHSACARRGGLVHGLFEAEVVAHPHAVAVVHESVQLTYQELNARANRLAHLLLEKGVAPDSLVVLSLKRSVGMLVGLLAILKAGAAYVPVDPDLPEARVSYLLGDCKPRLVLSSNAFREKLAIDASRVVCLDDAATVARLRQCPASNPALATQLSPDNLAYAIYTSGSTGKPKGVLVSHDNVCDFLVHAAESFLPEHVAGAVVSSTLSFDATVGSLLVPLCGGRYAELLPDDAFVLDRLSDCLSDDEEAMLFKLTPSHLEAMAAHGHMRRNPRGRHVLVVAGEALPPATLAHWSLDLLPSSLFINEYGPTETTVGSTTHAIERPLEYREGRAVSVPIGKAFGDMQLYVLNDELRLQCPGGIGELYIGGAGVARGYLNRPALTAEKFLPDPFGTRPGARFYRSGDLGRVLVDGSIEYLGRIDHQVKIRGIRIELGEIEAHLLQLPEVVEAVVLANAEPGGGAHLTAYLVLDEARQESAGLCDEHRKAGIKDQLSRLLPAYMVPETYVLLEELPLNDNGKLDRAALPAAKADDLVREAYVAPSNEIEERLCRMWQTLLRVERVGIFDNFFSLGGHSLLATRLVSALRQEFGVELELRALFEAPTIAGLGQRLARAGDRAASSPITRVARDQPLPLSFSQQRLWFIDQLGEGSAQYNLPGYFLLQGKFREDAFRQALQSVLERHEVLRTRFITVNGEARQVIAQDYELPFTRHDLTALADDEKAAEVLRLTQEAALRPFDLGADLMLRLRWLRLAEDVHLIVYTMHHIAADAWSRVILQRELSVLYAAYCKGEPDPLPPLPVQYADYAAWQRRWLEGQVLERSLSYWKKQLAGLPPVHALPLDKPRPARQRHMGRSHELVIGPKLAAGIVALNRRHNTTLFMFMHTAFALLLSRLSGERDIAVAGTITGRTHRDVEGLIGFFINDLVLRMQVDASRGFSALLERHRETILDAFAHRHIPFEMLVEELNPPRSMSYTPLYQIRLDVQNNEEGKLSLVDLELLNARVEAGGRPAQAEQEQSVTHDLYVSVSEQPNGLSVTWRYATDLFLPETIARWSAHFETLLEGIIAAPHQPAHGLPLLTKAEQQSLLDAGQGPRVAHAQGRCLTEWFEEQVRMRALEPAAMDGARSITYQELDAAAERLSRHLIERGVGPEVSVGLCIERSIEMVVGLLAILKADGCYVPLDPEYPAERLAYLLQAAACRLVLSGPSVLGRVPALDAVETVPLSAELQSRLASRYAAGAPPAPHRPAPGNTAYIMFTSGSTGRPKGVRISHAALGNYLCYASEAYFSARHAGAVVSTSLSFDATVTSLLAPLVAGKFTRLVESDAAELDRLQQVMTTPDQDLIFKLTPSHLEALEPLVDGAAAGSHLLVLGGEQLTNRQVGKWLRCRLPRAVFVNEYGPTETVVGCSTHWVTEVPASEAGPVPIGRPIYNTSLYVVDEQLNPVPIGVAGELLIGGAGVAQGYAGQPAQTAQRFIPDPFRGARGERLYRTGDRVRWRSDGNLEYLGRADTQVKIRGLRIEPAEIEQALLELPGVRECAVTVWGTAEEQRLVAHVVAEEDPANGATDDTVAMRRKHLVEGYRKGLGDRLPAYMVPQLYVFVPRLPLTVNGKLDRDALPPPEEGDLLKSRYVAPRNATHEKMCALWQEVLKVGRVGIDDDFFLLGGHSLLATRLVNLIREEFATELPLRTLFEAPTVAALSEKLGDAPRVPALPPLTATPRDRPLPLSHAQQRLWFIDQLGEGSAHYNVCGRFLLRGRFQEDAFKRALRSLLDRHEVLRTRFATVDGEARQVMVADYELPFTRHDLSALPDPEKAVEAQRLIREAASRPFDLRADLMLRVDLVALSDELHLILYTMHHIASDAWSQVILQRELSVLYAAYCRGEADPLPPLPVQYADYAVWQRQWLQGETLTQALSYWKRQLAALPPAHAVPLDRPRPARQRHVGRTHELVIGPQLAAGIAALNREHNTTLFMFMHTAFALLLGRWSGERDIVVGATITGRTHRDVEGLIGFFVNDLVLRMQIRGAATFTELLRQHRETILDAFAHRHVPFELLVEELNPPRSMSYDPLFQIKLDVQNNEEARLSLVDLELLNARMEARPTPARQVQSEHEHSIRHDLYVSISERQEGLSVSWHYDTDLFLPETIARWSSHFETLLESIVAAPARALERLPLLTSAQQQSVVLSGRGPEAAYPRGACIHQLFEQQVERTPHETALIAHNGWLTFRALNAEANRLAHWLLARGAGPGARVALCLPRSLDMMVGLLAILKAGAAYLPLDPAHPRARLEHMLHDSGCRWILTRKALASRLSWTSCEVLSIDGELRRALLKDYGADNPALQDLGLMPGHLAYVIYTSGSTGKPKGVMVEHDALVRYCDHARQRYYTSDLSGSLVATSCGFDLTIPALYLPLLAGGHVRLLDEGRELEELASILEEEKQPYLLRLTPSHLAGMLPLMAGKQNPCAHTFVIGGEPLRGPVVQALRALVPHARIYNQYGPAETVVACSIAPLVEDDASAVGVSSCPIGKALAHKQLLILNREMELEPPGVPGQLYVGGDGLARGYLGQPALTARKFLGNPFSASAGARLYETGDLVRWRPDGKLEFLGRLDHQVKLRGQRIELGEIEQHLLALADVRECAVVVSGGGEDQRLIAYVVRADDAAQDAGDAAPARSREVSIQAFRDELAKHLPAYMVPQVYVFLPRLPLTVNGKLDRNALPAPEDGDLLKSRYVAPRNATEEKMCALWQQVLKAGRVGVEDDFFLLGGHSLLAARLVNLIREEFAAELPLRALFEAPTVAALSEKLGTAPRAPALPPLTPVPRDRPLPLSYAQQRLWFIDQLGEGSAQYNVCGRFVLRGRFQSAAFERALRSLLDRHEVLRTRFAMVAGEARQVIVEDYELPFTRHDLSMLPDEEKVAEAQRLMRAEAARPFDLGADPMLRVRWLQLAEDVHCIGYTLHHVASDGWSRVILQRELSVLYAAYCRGEPDPLPPLPVQYADYAVWQRQWLQGDAREQPLAYWKKQLADLPVVHSLPLDRPRPARQRHRGRAHRVWVGPKLAAGIAELNRQHNTTLFMFMHTAFALLLGRWSGERDIVVGGTIANRSHRDVEGLIGFFINELALRLRIEGSPTFAELLRQHRETILDAFAHRHIPFEMLVEELNPERSLSHGPLYQIKLDVQNNEEAKLSLVDLELLNPRRPADGAAVQRQPSQQQAQPEPQAQPEQEHGVRHDLYVSVSEQPDGLELTWAYDADLFEPATIARWSAHFETLLEGIVAAPHESVYRLPLMTASQQQSLLAAGQGPQVAYPQGKCLHELFEAQVERSPDETAVVARDGSLTFRELNEQANRLAHYLLAHGVGPGARVALCTERSVDMMVGLLGILKAGGAYLPLDPAHPPARLEYMLEDSGCRCVLTQGELLRGVSLGDRHAVRIDAASRASLLADCASDNPSLASRGLTSRQLAYVIYTSGSTGRPKGVMVEHEGVVRYCDYARARYYCADLAGSLVATSYGFDLTVPGLYLPLLAGGHVRLLEEGRELEQLAAALIDAQRPCLLRLTPSHLTGMLPLLAGRQSTCAHALVIGGEALPVAVAQALRACLPRAMIYNHYGPTESIVGCSLLPLPDEIQPWAGQTGCCPIGTPLGHKQLLVLDTELQLQPVGTPGQLHVGGDALARGYLGQPALTAQKFGSNPFSDTRGARLYATGDRVRWRADGNLEFLGRIDQQVKIRGLRIELGEIEQRLLELPGVRDCAVAVSGTGDEQRLVAYVVPDEAPANDAQGDAAAERAQRLIEGYRHSLASSLPAHMIPTACVLLPQLPLTPNGKLDRKRLPAPADRDLHKAAYVAPGNEVEKSLCLLWQEVLHVEQVGVHDNFFVLGGHSLLAVRLISRIRETFDVELPVRALFEKATVGSLAVELVGYLIQKKAGENAQEMMSDETEEVVL